MSAFVVFRHCSFILCPSLLFVLSYYHQLQWIKLRDGICCGLRPVRKRENVWTFIYHLYPTSSQHQHQYGHLFVCVCGGGWCLVLSIYTLFKDRFKCICLSPFYSVLNHRWRCAVSKTKVAVVGHWQRTMPETPNCGSCTPKLLMQLWHIVDQAIISSRVWYSEAVEGSCFTKLPPSCDCWPSMHNSYYV